MAHSPPIYGGTTTSGGLSCVSTSCDKAGDSCVYCILTHPTLSPPPPPPPTHVTSSQNHVAPFLIATVCILGISFLFLTTCTIILRCRFFRRFNSRTSPSSNAPVDVDDHDLTTTVDHPVWHIATVGLQQSVIDSITAFKYKKLDEFLVDGCDCSVCLTEFGDGDDLRLLPKCSHAFHVGCIDMWLRSHKNCPVCRAPVVNEGFVVASGGGFDLTSSLGSDDNNNVSNRLSDDSDRFVVVVEGHEEGSGCQGREDDHVELPIQCGKIEEILKKNRELRIFSDLGENYRFGREGDSVDEAVRRSFSFNAVAGASILGDVCKVSEGCSSTGTSENAGGGGVEGEKIELKKVVKRGSSMSGLFMKSSSIDRALQKGPDPSMKRSSSSSSSKLFSFRRSKSQVSVLPL